MKYNLKNSQYCTPSSSSHCLSLWGNSETTSNICFRSYLTVFYSRKAEALVDSTSHHGRHGSLKPPITDHFFAGLFILDSYYGGLGVHAALLTNQMGYI